MKPRHLAELLEETLGASGVPRSLRAALENLLKERLELSDIEAAIRAEALTDPVSKVVAARVRTCEAAGTTPTLLILGSNADIVAGYCYVLPVDSPETVSLKRQRTQAAAILSAIRQLNFSDFEKFGARVLTELGATFSRVTPHGGDQGIDFYGSFSFGNVQDAPLPFLRLAHDVVVAFAGQAKHYPKSVLGTDVVRELIGAVTLARTGTFSKQDLDIFTDLNLRPFSPLVTMLFTTGNISKGARELAHGAGIIARSGEQLAVFLADKGVGMVNDPEPRFEPTAFRHWLCDGPY